LLVALFLGALMGGVTAGRFALAPVRLAVLGRCLLGGLLMGWGSWLIPGGNDWLILIGVPLLWPYAWVALLTMSATLYGVLWLGLKPQPVSAA